MNILIMFFVIAFTAIIIRSLIIRVATARYRYRLYAARDKLRMTLITNTVPDIDGIYDYYDSLICNLIKERYYLSIFSVIMLEIRHHKNPEIIAFNLMIAKATARVSGLEEVRQLIIKALEDYLLEQDVFIRYVLTPILKIVVGTQAVLRKLNSYAIDVTLYPETGGKIGPTNRSSVQSTMDLV